ncbi:MAG: YIP1 family protein [Candidatus Acidiferrales bacterium]
MSSPTSIPVPEAPAEIGSIGRLVGAIVNPKPTFESIVRRPDWILPIILGCLIFMAVVAAFTYRGGWPSFFEKQAANNSRMEQMTPEARESLIEKQEKIAPAFGYIEGAVLPFLSVLVVSGVLLGAFTMTGGTKTTFKTSLGIAAYAGLPWVINGLLGVLVIFLKDPASVDLQNLVASNPGAFLASDAPKWLAALLTSIDIFAIWNIALIGLGFSVINPKKLSFGKAFGTVLVLWMFYVAVKVGAIALLT